MFGIGIQELRVVLVITLFVFGGKNLPQIGADMGRALINFKMGISERPGDEANPVATAKNVEQI